jgi:hypothetical protein
MKEHAFTVYPEEVPFILDGKKTMCRRRLNHPPHRYNGVEWRIHKAGSVYSAARTEAAAASLASERPRAFRVGDRLWVREPWALIDLASGYEWFGDPGQCEEPEPVYQATVSDFEESLISRWRSAVRMPRWASRLLLEVTEVRYEKLRAITKEDAAREGCCWMAGCQGCDPPEHSPLDHFPSQWDRGEGARCRWWWGDDPWVQVLGFKVLAMGHDVAGHRKHAATVRAQTRKPDASIESVSRQEAGGGAAPADASPLPPPKTPDTAAPAAKPATEPGWIATFSDGSVRRCRPTDITASASGDGLVVWVAGRPLEAVAMFRASYCLPGAAWMSKAQALGTIIVKEGVTPLDLMNWIFLLDLEIATRDIHGVDLEVRATMRDEIERALVRKALALDAEAGSDFHRSILRGLPLHVPLEDTKPETATAEDAAAPGGAR